MQVGSEPPGTCVLNINTDHTGVGSHPLGLPESTLCKMPCPPAQADRSTLLPEGSSFVAIHKDSSDTETYITLFKKKKTSNPLEFSLPRIYAKK